MSLTIWLIQTVAFLGHLAVGLILPLLSNHVHALGANHVTVGFMFSIFNVFNLLSGPFIGSLSDLKGRKTVFMVTLLICSAANIITGFTGSITVILFIRAILGLFSQTPALTEALVADYEKDKKKQSDIYGKMAAISGMGLIIGPLIGGHFAENYPREAFTLIGLLVGILLLLNAGLVYVLPEVQSKSNKSSEKNTAAISFIHVLVSSSKESVQELGKVEWSKFWDVFLFKGLLTFVIALLYSNYPIYLKSTYSLTPMQIGYVISFQANIDSLSSFFMSLINKFYSNDKEFSNRNFHVFALSSISVLGLIYSFNVYLYAFWSIPLSIANTAGRLVNLEMLLKRGDEEHRGTLIGALNSMKLIAGIFAPIVAGVIVQYFGIEYVVFAAFGVTLVGSMLSYYKNKCKLLKRD